MTTEPFALHPSPIITVGYVMQVFFSLAVVLAIIFIAAKYLLPRLKINAPGKIIRVLDRIFIEPQVSAFILRVGKRAWLLVASNKQVETISEIDSESLPL